MAIAPPAPPYTIDDLVTIMAALRNPAGGCPWDLEQDFASIAPYTIEEAYEVADAIARDDMPALCDELGDLLLQSVYHARLAEERAAFDFNHVVAAICAKMVRRHPHVFGDAQISDAQSQSLAWEDAKRAERGEQGEHSLLDGVARALPALMRAQKLQRRAAGVGFDWPDEQGPRLKIDEELAEVAEALRRGDPAPRVAEEVGDLLFSVVNWARHLGIDAEVALRDANDRFASRFAHVERLADGRVLAAMTLDELEQLWQQAKLAHHR